MGKLSKNARQSIVQKALTQKDKTLKELAEQHQIGYSTLQRWIKLYRYDDKIRVNVQKAHKELSAAEKLQHLIATGLLDESRVGAYCREQGIYSFQLKQWKETFMTEKGDERKRSDLMELRTLRAENKALRQELLRKERALSETAALLVLKRKAGLIWGEDVDA